MMKKILFAIVLSLMVFTVGASEKAVISANDQFHRKALTLDFKGALDLTHPEYSGKTSEGMLLNYAVIKKMIMLYQMMEKLDRPDVTLTEFIEFGLVSQGQVMSPELRQQVKAMENTAEGKQKLALMVQFLKESRRQQFQMREAALKAWAEHKVISCKVDGNNAVLIFENPAPDAGFMEKAVTEWVKIDGKWLIKKSVTEKYPKQK